MHLLLMYCIRNLSIGVSYDGLLNLFLIFEYLTSGPFAGPLSADIPDVEKNSEISVAMGILNFELKMCRKVYKYVNLMQLFFFFFWLTSFRLMADRVIFDIGRVVDKACVYTMKSQ